MFSSRVSCSKFQVGENSVCLIKTLWKPVFLDPIGSSLPKFDIDQDSYSITRSLFGKIALTCPAQAFPLPIYRLVHFWNKHIISSRIGTFSHLVYSDIWYYVDPIGSSSPKFSSSQVTSGFIENSGSSIALTCRAQGFPVPVFRYFIDQALCFRASWFICTKSNCKFNWAGCN